jgi:hypothetical protein
VGLDQPLADGETQTEPTGPTLLTDLNISVENALAIRQRDAGPLVGDADLDARALGRTLVKSRHRAGCNFDGSAQRGKLDRVTQKVGQDLTETDSIEARSLCAGIDSHLDFQFAGFEQRPKESDDFIDHG